MTKQFYIQDVRQFVGNSMLWYVKDGKGYHTDIRLAERFDRAEAERLNKSEKYLMWPCGYIDTKQSPHIDMQHVSIGESDSWTDPISREERFMIELRSLLKKHDAFITMGDLVSHGYGDAFPQKIVIYLQGQFDKGGEPINPETFINFEGDIDPDTITGLL